MSEMGQPQLPKRLTHYYRKASAPFQTLTDLGPVEADRVVKRLAKTDTLPRRLRTPHYLPERRRIERIMHDQFVAKGGTPQRSSPHYSVLGRWSHWDADSDFLSCSVTLKALPPGLVSFTYPDSWVSFVGETLAGQPLPRFDYHGSVFRLDELESLLRTYGMPGERWRHEKGRELETYIEAQIWTDDVRRLATPE